MPHHQQKVNEKRYTTTGITPHRRSLPATGRLPPDGRTGRSFIEQRRLIADSKSGQCSVTAGGTARNHRTYTSGVCPIRPAAGTSHRQMRKTSATLRLATGRGTGLL